MTESMSSFDPHSNDAMFAKVLAKLDEHGAMLQEIRQNSQMVENEIASLKSWKDNFQGKMTIIAALVSIFGTLVVSLIVSLFK